MALQKILGNYIAYPAMPDLANSPAFSSILMDASGEKVAFMGEMYNEDYESKDITKVHVRTGSVTFNAGSVLTCSLQNLSATGGPPRPDESVDQSGTLTGAAVTANSYLSFTLDASRTVGFGEKLAIVLEITTFNTGDIVNITGLAMASGSVYAFPVSALKSGGSWAVATPRPNVVLEFSDGSFGTLFGSFHASATSLITAYNSGSTPDEQALRFTPAFKGKAVGFWANMLLSNSSSTADMILYDSGGSALLTRSLAQADFASLGSIRYGVWMFGGSEAEVAANTLHRLALKATNATNAVQFSYIDVAAAGHMQGHTFSDGCYLDTRSDGGAWSATTTRRPLFGLIYSQLEDGAGGAGSTPYVVGS